MASIGVIVQDESGKQIGDRVDLPTGVLPPFDDSRFSYLRFIDPYGDTVFNRLQLQPVSEELHALKTMSQNKKQGNLIEEIEKLIKLCHKEPHLYLKFIGD